MIKSLLLVAEKRLFKEIMFFQIVGAKV